MFKFSLELVLPILNFISPKVAQDKSGKFNSFAS